MLLAFLSVKTPGVFCRFITLCRACQRSSHIAYLGALVRQACIKSLGFTPVSLVRIFGPFMPINSRQKGWLRTPTALTKKISKETARAYSKAIQYYDKSDVSRGLDIVPELDRIIKGTMSDLISKLFRRLSMASQ